MASRIGNVIFMDDLISKMANEFGEDKQLIYNVFAGYVLKSNPSMDKNIDLDQLGNPKNSSGLYISYTMAKLHSAGLDLKYDNEFYSKDIQFAYLKCKYNLAPHILFDAVISKAKELSQLYEKHQIKGQEGNKKIFKPVLSDMLLGCKKLGLFVIEKV